MRGTFTPMIHANPRLVGQRLAVPMFRNAFSMQAAATIAVSSPKAVYANINNISASAPATVGVLATIRFTETLNDFKSAKGAANEVFTYMRHIFLTVLYGLLYHKTTECNAIRKDYKP